MRGGGWAVQQSEKSASLWEKLQELDVRYVYLLVWIVVSIPILKPLGLPLGSISEETMLLYDFIDHLPPRSIVVMIADQGPAAATECQPGMVAIFRHCVEKDLRVLFFASRTEAVPFIEQCMIDVLGASKDHPDYGKLYVNLGFIPQYEIGLSALAANIFYTTTDTYGNSLKSMEFFKDLPTGTAKDWSLAIYFGNSNVDWVVRQVNDPYGCAVAGGVGAVLVSRIYPYYPQQVIGFLTGLRGSAEYEVLVGKPGSAVAGMDAQSLAHLAIIVMIIIGNIGYFVSKRRIGGF